MLAIVKKICSIHFSEKHFLKNLIWKNNLFSYVLLPPLKLARIPSSSFFFARTLSVGLDPRFQTHVCVFRPLFFSFFFFPSVWTVKSHEFTIQGTKSIVHVLFTGLTILFTHLKIILLRCFQFSVSVKISCIHTEPKSLMIFINQNNCMNKNFHYKKKSYMRNNLYFSFKHFGASNGKQIPNLEYTK